MNLDYKVTNNLSTKYAWTGSSKLNDYRGYAWVALKNLDPGLVTNISETMNTTYSPRYLEWLKPNFSYSANYRWTNDLSREGQNISSNLRFNSSFTVTPVQIFEFFYKIVTFRKNDLDLENNKGEYVDPENWNNILNDPEITIIDVRNDFEVELGTFKGSVNPKTGSFHEFSKWWRNKSKFLKDKKIAMFCTGGIRCEKATSFLKSEGLDEVYHLKGGILNYFDKVGNLPTSKWKGDCFVFDQRVTVNTHLEAGEYELCHACRSPLRLIDKNHEHYEKGISCHKCFGTKTDKKILSLKERKKQIDLLKDRRSKNE